MIEEEPKETTPPLAPYVPRVPFPQRKQGLTFTTVKPNGDRSNIPIVLGGLITHLALKEGLDEAHHTPVPSPITLDQHYITITGWLSVEFGNFSWLIEKSHRRSISLPSPDLTKIFPQQPSYLLGIPSDSPPPAAPTRTYYRRESAGPSSSSTTPHVPYDNEAIMAGIRELQLGQQGLYSRIQTLETNFRLSTHPVYDYFCRQGHIPKDASHPSWVETNPGNTLFVTGLSSRVTQRELEDFFSKEGKVSSVFLVMEPRTRISRGFAFVTMDTVEDADRCIKYLNQSVLEGRYITVEKDIVVNSVVGMVVVMTMIIGGHQDVHHIEVVEVILLAAPLMLKGQGGTGQGHTLLMEAQTEDMGVALVPMADKRIVVSYLEMNGDYNTLLSNHVALYDSSIYRAMYLLLSELKAEFSCCVEVSGVGYMLSLLFNGGLVVVSTKYSA
uniref:RRM domain-containing protein n=1 Tax=Chenopodium quinoa TaxID=63459 RepID=A0A803LIR3_CHEQI